MTFAFLDFTLSNAPRRYQKKNSIRRCFNLEITYSQGSIKENVLPLSNGWNVLCFEAFLLQWRVMICEWLCFDDIQLVLFRPFWFVTMLRFQNQWAAKPKAPIPVQCKILVLATLDSSLPTALLFCVQLPLLRFSFCLAVQINLTFRQYFIFVQLWLINFCKKSGLADRVQYKILSWDRFN